jgi:hypothetical protein
LLCIFGFFQGRLEFSDLSAAVLIYVMILTFLYAGTMANFYFSEFRADLKACQIEELPITHFLMNEVDRISEEVYMHVKLHQKIKKNILPPSHISAFEAFDIKILSCSADFVVLIYFHHICFFEPAGGICHSG